MDLGGEWLKYQNSSNNATAVIDTRANDGISKCHRYLAHIVKVLKTGILYPSKWALTIITNTATHRRMPFIANFRTLESELPMIVF